MGAGAEEPSGRIEDGGMRGTRRYLGGGGLFIFGMQDGFLAGLLGCILGKETCGLGLCSSITCCSGRWTRYWVEQTWGKKEKTNVDSSGKFFLENQGGNAAASAALSRLLLHTEGVEVPKRREPTYLSAREA